MSIRVAYSIECDGCGARMSAGRKSPNLLPHIAYNEAWKKAKAAKWVKRNMGSKGDRHYCFGCLSNQPEITTWHMQKILTKP